LERAQVTPHVALRKPGFGRGVEGGEARAAMRQRQRRVGYWKSQRRRKVEITALAFNLVRMRRLLAA